MSESKYLTKKEIIIETANFIIAQKGSVTTLEIMEVLQKSFPDETWVLSTISSCMESVRDNYKVHRGGRCYSYTSLEVPCLNVSEYSILIEGEAVRGSKSILAKLCLALNLPYRFSETHNEFQDITKLPFPYLENIVAKDLEGMSKAEIKFYMETPLFRYYASKV